MILEAQPITGPVHSHAPQRRGEFDPAILTEIVRRVVDVANPRKVILFGSAARGAMGPNSDVDLLVVKEGVHRRELAGRIYESLWGVDAAVGVVVAKPDDVERYADSHALVIKTALEEGCVVYEAQRSAHFDDVEDG